MNDHNVSPARPALLLIGASRGLGLALAAEFLRRGWRVTATIRQKPSAELRELIDRFAPHLHIETLDMTSGIMIDALRDRLKATCFDMLFVNAGITNDAPDTPIGQVSTQDFIDVMQTNALAPMRVIETLDTLVMPGGLIGVMSSGQGSIANNVKGLRELYRGSKAALNQFMRCYAARTASASPRPLALIAPGWVRTALGGPQAPFSINETIPGIVEGLLAHRSEQGLVFRDHAGRPVPW